MKKSTAPARGGRAKDEQPSHEPNAGPTLYCSFCGKSQHEVSKLIAGPTVVICDECVTLCMTIIEAPPG